MCPSLRPSWPWFPSRPHRGVPGGPADRRTDGRSVCRSCSCTAPPPGGAPAPRMAPVRRWGSGTSVAAAARNPQLSPSLPAGPCSSPLSVPRPEFAHPLLGDGDSPRFSPEGSRRSLARQRYPGCRSLRGWEQPR